MPHARSDPGLDDSPAESSSFRSSTSFPRTKRTKWSDREPLDCSASAARMNSLDRCSERHPIASCSGDQPQSSGMFVATQGNSCPVTNGGGIYSHSGMGCSNGQNGTYGAYPQHQPLEGCMYVNEHGHMCGPYAPKQLYEGLSSGFLPQDLAIYALVGGQMLNPVALSFLEQFLSQWNSAGVVTTPNESKENKTVARTDKMALPDALSSDESCWMFEDSDGSRHGPHSLAELSYWLHSSYLQDLSMVYHVDSKFGPFTLVSLIDWWSGGHTEHSEASENDSGSASDVMGDIVDDISHQLHAGIMKSARKILVDEIFSCVLPEIIARRKTEKQLAAKSKLLAVKPDSKKASALKGKAHAKSINHKKGNSYNTVRATSPVAVQSTAVHAKFADILSAVWQTLHYESMKNIWDGILYDPVMDYCGAWIKRNHHSSLPCTSIPGASDKGNKQEADGLKVICDSEAHECDMDFPPGFGPRLECASPVSLPLLDIGSCDDKISWWRESSSTTYFDASSGVQVMLANELYVAAKETLFHHFRDVIAEEITNCLCFGLEGITDQELIRTPVHAPDSPSSAGMDIHETPPIPSEMVQDKLLDIAKMTTDAITSPAEMTLDAITSPSEMALDAITSPAEMALDPITSPAEMALDAITSPAEMALDAITSPAEMAVDEVLVTAEITTDTVPSPADMAAGATPSVSEVATDKMLTSHVEHQFPSSSYASVFEKLDVSEAVELDESFDEVPPGLETGSASVVVMDKNKYRPSKSINSMRPNPPSPTPPAAPLSPPPREMTPVCRAPRETDFARFPDSAPIVIDNGASTFRIGWAGEAEPRVSFRNIVQRPRHRSSGETVTVVGDTDPALMKYFDCTRTSIRSAFDDDVVYQFEYMEYILDYAFDRLGATSEVGHPILMTECECNPSFSRARMSELLFETYGVPSVAFGIDDVFSYKYNQKLGNCGEDGLAISCEFGTCHVVPFLKGQPVLGACCRTNVGGSHITDFLRQLLSLKYPYHVANFSWEKAEELKKEHCYIAADYMSELQIFKNNKEEAEEKTRYWQLPWVPPPRDEPPSEEELARKAAYKEKAGQRLRDMAAAKKSQKIADLEEKLSGLEDLMDHLDGADEQEATSILGRSGYLSQQEIKSDILKVTQSLRKAKGESNGNEENADASGADKYPLVSVPDDMLTPEQLKEKKKQILLKTTTEGKLRAKQKRAEEAALREKEEEERRTENPELYFDELRARYLELSEKVDQRKRQKVNGNNNSSGAVGRGERLNAVQKERMRLLTTAAFDRGKGEDTFGMRDEDWLVYKKMSKESEEDDGKDDDESELARIASKIQEVDPTFVNKHDAVEPAPDPHKVRPLTADDFKIAIGIERFRCPEVLFQPGMIGLDQAGIDEMVSISLRRLMEDESVKERLCQSILVTGGSSLFPGMIPRLESGIRQFRPYLAPLKLVRAADPILDAWRGAAAFAASSKFGKQTFTLADYREHGESLFHRYNIVYTL